MVEKEISNYVNWMFSSIKEHSDSKGNMDKDSVRAIGEYFGIIPEDERAEVFTLLLDKLEDNDMMFDYESAGGQKGD